MGKEIGSEIEKNWGSFLDDCEIPVDEDKVDPEDLLEVLNSIDGNLQFTMQKSKEMVPFLDILIRKDATKIWTDYTQNQLIQDYICHFHLPTQNIARFINVSFCLARRICMIVENEKARKSHLKELREILLQQNCPLRVINNGINKAINIPQAELQQPNDQSSEEHLCYLLCQLSILTIHQFSL